ncbi:MAG: gluconokinase [Opitutales bacterium]|nr:gluconokinase [Opitutales bacterium]
MIFIIMGVCGSGKSTLGQMLSKELGSEFLEGDDFHSPANQKKMSDGNSLTESDRAPWFQGIRKAADQYLSNGETIVVSCSALSKSGRQILGTARKEVQLIFLYASEAILSERMYKRENHFMPASLLHSQMETLEEPEPGEAIAVSVDKSPSDVLKQILSILNSQYPC